MAGALLLGACGPMNGSAPDPTLLQMIAQVELAPINVRHQGVREHYASYVQDGVRHELRYTEDVYVDGTGKFAIVPKDVPPNVEPDPASFTILQYNREGYFNRYRDLRLRDLDLLAVNYEISALGFQTQHLNRPAWVLALSRKPTGHDRTYVVTADLETGLVLKYIEYGPNNQVLSSMEYLSIDLNPDFSNMPVSWHVSSNQEQLLDLNGDPLTLETQLGFEPRQPTWLPEGYALDEASSVIDIEGNTWLKLTYTDGLEVAFFLHRPASPQTSIARSSATVSGSSATGLISQTEETADAMFYNQTGPIVTVFGQLRDQSTMAVGKLALDDILHLVASAGL